MTNHPDRSKTAPQFHEGQEVEVWVGPPGLGVPNCGWRKAKIINRGSQMERSWIDAYLVEFPDGTRAAFDAEHIRAIDKYEFAGAIQRARSTNQIP